MVIVASDQDSDSKTPTSPTSTRYPTSYTTGSRSVASSSQPSQSQRYEDEAPPQYTPPSQSPQTPLLLPYHQQPVPDSQRRARSRFFETFLLAACVYLLFVILGRSMIIVFWQRNPQISMPGGHHRIEVVRPLFIEEFCMRWCLPWFL